MEQTNHTDVDDVLPFSEPETVWRRLSHDAFAPTEAIASQGEDPTPHIAAWKISTSLRIAQVAFAIVACCLASGIIWGFAALKPLLIANGVYSEFCTKSSSHVKRSAASNLEIPCAEQDLRLNLFFVSASTMANISTLFAGATLDGFGRRTSYLISSGLLSLGCILLGLSFAIPHFDGYLIGNVLLGIGGTFLFVPSFQLANAFPKHSGLVVALITGAFDSSAAVFLFYRIANGASHGRFSLSKFFFGYLMMPALIFLAELTFMPSRAYHTTSELEKKIKKAEDSRRDVHESDDEISSDRMLQRVRIVRAERRQAKLNQIEELVGDGEERQERVKLVEERQAASGVWGALHDVPTHKQMLNPWFILILLLTSLQMLRMNYFIATLQAQYRYMLDSEDYAEHINHFFDVALPVAGVVSTPFIGILLSNLSVSTTLIVLTFFIALVGILNCLPFVWAGFATVIAFVVFRPFYYSVMSDYAIKVFGFATFGRIYGTLIAISGLINFVQPGLDALTHGPLRGNPTPINIILAVTGTIIAASLTAFVSARSRSLHDSQTGKNGDHEAVPLIREEEEEHGTMD